MDKQVKIILINLLEVKVIEPIDRQINWHSNFIILSKNHDLVKNITSFIYGKLEYIDTRIKRRRLQFAGHCYRSNEHCKQFVSDLLFYETEPSTKGKIIRDKARLLKYDQLLMFGIIFIIYS